MKTWTRLRPERCQCPTCGKKTMKLLWRRPKMCELICTFCEFSPQMTRNLFGLWTCEAKHWTERYNCQTRRLESDVDT